MIHYSIFRSDQETLLVLIFKCIILIIFFYLNVLVLAFLRKHRIAPSNTTILIKCKTVCSLLMILDILFFNLSAQGPIYNLIYASFICYFLNYGFSFCFFSSYCLEIMLLLSIDRYICIVLPFKYSSLRRVHFYLGMVLAFVISVIITILDSTQVSVKHKFIKNETTFTCDKREFDVSTNVFVILIYSSQVLIFVIINTVTTVYYKLIYYKLTDLFASFSHLNIVYFEEFIFMRAWFWLL